MDAGAAAACVGMWLVEEVMAKPLPFRPYRHPYAALGRWTATCRAAIEPMRSTMAEERAHKRAVLLYFLTKLRRNLVGLRDRYAEPIWRTVDGERFRVLEWKGIVSDDNRHWVSFMDEVLVKIDAADNASICELLTLQKDLCTFHTQIDQMEMDEHNTCHALGYLYWMVYHFVGESFQIRVPPA